MTSINGQNRQSNFELYRIICIFLIVLMHSFGSGMGTFNSYMGILVNVLGNIGVTGFILLSGYFGINLKLKKLIKIDIMMIVWSFFGLAVMTLIPDSQGLTAQLTAKAVIKCFIPFASHSYWFISCYFALCILSPFINDYLGKISENTHKKLIIYAGFIYLLMPTVFFFDQTGDGGKGIVNMVLAYIIGRYIGMYHRDEKIPTLRLWTIFICTVVVNYGLNFILYRITNSTACYYARDNSIFTMLQAVLLLLIFMQFKLSSRFINLAAANIIAVYVLEDAVKRIIGSILPVIYRLGDTSWRIIIMLIVSAATFLIASVLESLRKLIFGKAEDIITDWAVSKWKRQ